MAMSWLSPLFDLLERIRSQAPSHHTNEVDDHDDDYSDDADDDDDENE